MALPTSRSTSYSDDGPPAISAQDLNDLQDYLAYLYNGRFGGQFGDGSDGALTFDGTSTVTLGGGGSLAPSGGVYTLTRDIFPSSLTIAGGTLKGPYGIYVRDSLTTNGGKISATGTDASGSTGGTGTLDGSLSGTIGGPNGTNTNGSNGTNLTNALGGAGGNGGTSLSAGGTGGTVTAPTVSAMALRAYAAPFLGALRGGKASGTIWIVGGASGAAGGGGGGANFGGGGGTGGGVIAIAARNISLLNASDLIAAGGVGGAGATNSGGGGGGGGGVVILYYQSLSVTNGTLNGATCCPGGAGGTGQGGGTPNGVAGSNGNVYLINLTYV